MWKIAIRSKGFWLGLILSFAGLWVALSGVKLEKLGSELSSVPWALAIAVGLVSLLVSVIRAWRWKLGIESFSPVEFKNVFSAFMAGMFGLNVIPARVGEYLRVLVLGKNSSLSQSSILATVVFERVMDGLTILVIFAAALLIGSHLADSQHFLGTVRREFILLVPLIFVLSLGFLYAVSRHPQTAANVLRRFSGRLAASRLGARLPGMVERFSDGLVIFSDMSRLFRYIAWSFAAWMTIALYFYLNFRILGIQLGMVEAMMVMSAVVVGAMIPAAPGFVGTYHAFCKAALVAFGVDEARALSFAVVTHIISYLLHTLVGFLCVVRENVHWADLSMRQTEAPPAK